MKHFSKEFYEEFYFKQGLNFNQIGQKFNISKVSVRYYFYKNGFIPRETTGAWNSGLTYKDDSRILSGEKHPRWKDTSKYYIDYKLKRKEIINEKTKCELCNKIATTLHHIDKDTNNNEYSNLQPLCSSCHTTLHNKERGITEYRHNCDYCGKLFVVLSNKNCNQRFCCQSCASKGNYKDGKTLPQNRKGKTFYNHTCPICKRTFKTSRKDSVSCSISCRRKLRGYYRQQNN